MNKIISIGEKIWQEAEKQRFTKTSFCKKMGISRTTLYSWIKALTSPSLDELAKASKLLNTTFKEDGADPISQLIGTVNNLMLSNDRKLDLFIESKNSELAGKEDLISTLKEDKMYLQGQLDKLTDNFRATK